MTNEEKAIEQLERISEHLSSIGEKEDYTDIAIQALEQTRWIPVSERLPEENIHVLCQFYMGGMAECYHAHDYWHIVGGFRIKIDDVLAWMPLPEPYAESEDEE